VRFENKNIFFHFENALAYSQQSKDWILVHQIGP
jgi:hypothetical protein